jgi:hypothetical protein
LSDCHCGVIEAPPLHEGGVCSTGVDCGVPKARRIFCTQGRLSSVSPKSTVGTSIMYQLCDKCKLIHRRSRKANFRIGKLVNIILKLSSI